ncbi:MAG: acetylxylan esterase [Anaerolineae bacterium]|nr:acetylxylan esterase [Anaerolineae bacterium]
MSEIEDSPWQYFEQAHRDWERARRQASGGILAIFNQPQHEQLLSFEDVRTRLRLFNKFYKGVFNVPLDKIVGSVDRYQDFTREFLPLVEEDASRWQRVAILQRSRGIPPIELYKIGDVYFVRDGNHRVSVMRQLGAKAIEAHVWEYPTPVNITAKDDINDILTKAEHAEFMRRTHLDDLRPGNGIRFTAPDGYDELERQIEVYRQNLTLIDGYEVSYEEAVTGWYDMVYSLAAETIEELGLLDQFPDRTVADLYAWVYRHREELAREAGRKVSTKDAARDLVKKDEPRRRRPVIDAVHQVVTGVEHLADRVLDALTGEVEIAPVRQPEVPDGVTPMALLSRQVQSTAPALAYPNAGREAWEEWQPELRAKLFELLGVRPRSGETWGPPKVEVTERATVKGATRERIVITMDDGLPVPGYLFLPDKPALGKKAPAVLIYVGHGTIQQAAGLQNSYHNGNALALAQAGFVTLSIEGRGFGELGQVDYAKLDAAARLIGQSWVGLLVEDGLRALDYVQTRPEVDPDRLGVAGASVGGALAMYTAALDERIIASIVGDYLVRFDDISHHGPRYRRLCIAGLRRYAEAGDIGALIAPRPVLYLRSEAATDQNRGFFLQTRLPFELLRVPDRLRYEETRPGRMFDNQAAARWLTRWLVEEEAIALLKLPYDHD